MPFLMREVAGLRAVCSSLDNWKRTPLLLSNIQDTSFPAIYPGIFQSYP
jgi:hypothetical protein